jgi:hypothetical protein
MRRSRTAGDGYADARLAGREDSRAQQMDGDAQSSSGPGTRATQRCLLQQPVPHSPAGCTPLRVGPRVKKKAGSGRKVPSPAGRLWANGEGLSALCHLPLPPEMPDLCLSHCLTLHRDTETFAVCPGYQYRKFSDQQSSRANWDCCSTVHRPGVSIIRARDRKPTPPCSH